MATYIIAKIYAMEFRDTMHAISPIFLCTYSPDKSRINGGGLLLKGRAEADMINHVRRHPLKVSWRW